MAPSGPFAPFVKGYITFYNVVAEMKVGPQEEMANPQGMNMLVVERHGVPEDFVSFRTLCGVQWSPLVFELVLNAHMYRKSKNQPGNVANSARGQLNREN